MLNRVTTIVACSIAFVVSPLAAEVLDQHNEVVSSLADTASLFSQEIVQTFTVGVTGTLKRIEVQLGRFSFTSDRAVLSVYNTTGGMPDTPLGSASVLSAVISTTVPTFVSFDISSHAITVHADDVFAFGISSSEGGLYLLPFAHLTDTYPAGSSYRRTLSAPPGPWQIQAGRDYGFKTYVEPAAGFPGDYNQNGAVDAADYTLWRDTLGEVGTGLAADGNNSGTIDAGDYDVWKSQFGQMAAGSGSGGVSPAHAAVPEPAVWAMLLAAALIVYSTRRSSRMAPHFLRLLTAGTLTSACGERN